MLSAVLQANKQIVFALSCQKDMRPFTCPDCGEEVVLRKGKLVAHHFAHKPPVTCQYGIGETEKHRQCKVAIFQELSIRPEVTKCEIERNLKSVRPDISCYINRTPVAIEVQISSLSVEQITRRTLEYTRKGIHVLWISPHEGRLFDDRITIKSWEKFAHSLYFGKVYFWLEGLKVLPYRFDPVYTDVELTRWGGGYTKKLKRTRIPKCLGTMDLIADFEPKVRQEWQTKDLFIPACKLWTAKWPDT